MYILSLFDWKACWYVALNRAWIEVEWYFASEIDKYSMKIAKKNFPYITHIWNVTDIQWEDYLGIDILMWWSPCQTFSSGWNGTGFEWKSWLFYEYARILSEAKPKFFLLENVKMKKEWQDEISRVLWVEPVAINSSLVSGQNRLRLYWVWKINSQWKYEQVHIPIPEDKNISVSDILDSQEYEIWDMKPSVKINVENQIDLIRKSEKDIQVLDCTSGWQDNKVWIKKSPTLRSWNSFTLVRTKNKWVRLLTISEKEKLQTLPVWYTEWVSMSKRHKMIGDWWTIDIISHILSYLQ